MGIVDRVQRFYNIYKKCNHCLPYVQYSSEYASYAKRYSKIKSPSGNMQNDEIIMVAQFSYRVRHRMLYAGLAIVSKTVISMNPQLIICKITFKPKHLTCGNVLSK